MYCEKCGYPLPQEGTFCPKCGTKRNTQNITGQKCPPSHAPVSAPQQSAPLQESPRIRPQSAPPRKPPNVPPQQSAPLQSPRTARPQSAPAKKENKTLLYTLLGVSCGVLVALVALIVLFLSDGTPSSGDTDTQLSVQVQGTETANLPSMKPLETLAPPATTQPPTSQPPTVTKETVPLGSCYVDDPYSFQGDYFCPDSDWRYLTEEDVAWMNHDREYLQMAINEIYARHGYRFQTAQIRDYFEGKSWYVGILDPSYFTDSMLNTYELYNISFLASQKAPQ